MQLLALAGDLGPNWFHTVLRALVLLARSGEQMSSKEIADAVGTDPTAVRKMFARLAKSNLIIARGGRNGGYSLAVAPCDITIGHVYRIMGAAQNTNPSSVKQTGAEPFIADIVLKAEQQFQAYLDEFTISDILEVTV